MSLVGQKDDDASGEGGDLPGAHPETGSDRSDRCHKPRCNPGGENFKAYAKRPCNCYVDRAKAGCEEVGDHLAREGKDGEVQNCAGK